MRKVACRYAIVRFLPYPETGEFANVGVVLACPQTGFFGFRLQDRRYARITGFFEHLDGKLYTRAIGLFKQELLRVGEALAARGTAEADVVRHTFDALIYPREAIVRFAEARPLLTEDPRAALDQLFGRYVEHDFAQKEQHEREMERRVQDLLRDLALPLPFKPEEIGNDEIHARFPLVQMREGQPAKIIKPLYLAQDEPNKIYDHGDRWVAKIGRLRRARLLPTRVLFTLEPPSQGDDKRYRAFVSICEDLEAQEIAVAPIGEEQRIAEFAQD